VLSVRRSAALVLLGATVLTAACTGKDPAPVASRTSATTSTPTPTATPVPSTTAAPVALTKLGTFDGPVWAGPVPGDPAHLWVVERAGRIVQTTPDGVKTAAVLDLTKLVTKGNEQGLLGFAFDPGFLRNRHFYVDYTDVDGNTRVVRFTWQDDDAVAPTPLLRVEQPYSNHNGGELLFDRTGKLLVGLGDGGSAGDPGDRAQSLGSNLGKILRIDPSTGQGLPDNPYPVNNRVWALGLRNPWRFSFDTNGDLYLGDVGQNKVEEVDVVPPRLQRGANYGWSVYEGDQVFKKDELLTLGGPLVRPAYTYLHSEEGGCSVTGGVVYRGHALPELVGSYVFGDYCIGQLLGARRTPTGLTPPVELGVRVAGLGAFGVDHDGELLVMSADTLYRLTPG
jgi:glucose/arabinose dehydrogenase